MDEDSSTEQKTWHVYSFAKRNVLRLHLIESRESFCQRDRGRSFHVDGKQRKQNCSNNHMIASSHFSGLKRSTLWEKQTKQKNDVKDQNAQKVP